MSEPRVFLRAPAPGDRDSFLRATQANRSLHEPWIHPPVTPGDFDLYLKRFEGPDHESRLVCLADTGDLVGVINLNNIIRGYFQNSFLGFYGFVPHTGHGLMLEGLQLVSREAFGPLELNRLEANIQPGNERSIRLVQGAGFRMEGHSPRYLRIAGKWRDHQRWALLCDED
ncbi:MAG: GNAT family protein [Akkermansiaceae bacterium]